jgi:DNA-binding transcriptional regulator GbsR (MarR family)
MKKADKILKIVSLNTSREILGLLAKKPMTVRELRRKSKKLRNRVSFYKSLNKMVRLGVVKRYHNPDVRGFTYELSKAKITIDLRGGKVEII